jgi:hypothetical protein
MKGAAVTGAAISGFGAPRSVRMKMAPMAGGRANLRSEAFRTNDRVMTVR